jgi:hypothetical protein
MQVHKASTQTTKCAAKTVENSMASERKRKSCHSDQHFPNRSRCVPASTVSANAIARPTFSMQLRLVTLAPWNASMNATGAYRPSGGGKIAKALGLDVPLHLQQRADEVIE